MIGQILTIFLFLLQYQWISSFQTPPMLSWKHNHGRYASFSRSLIKKSKEKDQKQEIAEHKENLVPNALESDPEREARREALSGVLHQIEKSYGKGTIQKLGEATSMN